MNKPIVVVGAALIILGAPNKEPVIDSFGKLVTPTQRYEVFKRSDDGKVSIKPTDKPLTK